MPLYIIRCSTVAFDHRQTTVAGRMRVQYSRQQLILQPRPSPCFAKAVVKRPRQTLTCRFIDMIQPQLLARISLLGHFARCPLCAVAAPLTPGPRAAQPMHFLPIFCPWARHRCPPPPSSRATACLSIGLYCLLLWLGLCFSVRRTTLSGCAHSSANLVPNARRYFCVLFCQLEYHLVGSHQFSVPA